MLMVVQADTALPAILGRLLWGAAEPLRRMLGILLKARVPVGAVA